MEVKFTVPVYMNLTKKKVVLVGLNLYRNIHFRANNGLKKKYLDYIRSLNIQEKIKGKYEVTYTYYYKNKLSDTPNICAVIDKYALDALQELGVVEQDNVDHLKAVHYITGGLDKANPRVEITIKSYLDDYDLET